MRNTYFHLSKNNPCEVMHISTAEIRSCPASTSCALSALVLSKILIGKLYALWLSEKLCDSESWAFTCCLTVPSFQVASNSIPQDFQALWLILWCTVPFPGLVTRQSSGQRNSKLSLNHSISSPMPLSITVTCLTAIFSPRCLKLTQMLRILRLSY